MPSPKAAARPLLACTWTFECTCGVPALSCHAVLEQPASSASRAIKPFTAAILRLLAGALQAVAHRRPFGGARRRLDQDLLALGAIEFA
jgi:hypothetical protein